MKTHKVIKTDCEPDTNNIIFVGSSFECQEFKDNLIEIIPTNEQKLKIVNLTIDEIKFFESNEFKELNNEFNSLKEKNFPEIDYSFMFLYPHALYPDHPEFVKKILSGDYSAKELYEMKPKEIFDELDLTKLSSEKVLNFLEANDNFRKNILSKLVEKRNDFKMSKIVREGHYGNVFNKNLQEKITEEGKENIKIIQNLIQKFEERKTFGATNMNIKNLKLDETVFIKQKIVVICLNCKSIFIDKQECCSECNMKSFTVTHSDNYKLAVNLDSILQKYRNDNKILNLNENIKFIPNEKGIQIIYEYKNKWIKNPEKYTKFEYPLENILNDIDLETGQYEMQLWEFINCFGQSESLGNGFDTPFKENNIFIHTSKFK